MIMIKNKASINKMAEAGRRLSLVFSSVIPALRSGVTTAALDDLIATELRKQGLLSRSKGYKGYQHVSCISVNDEVVHGVPSDKKVLKTGDIVTIDVCASWKGYCADMARSFVIESLAESRCQELIAAAESSLKQGIACARVGNRLSDISAAIQQEVEARGCSVIRDFAGHGIGKQMHEDPEILNYGKPGKGPVLRPGMTFALEPMITEGSHKVYIAEDGWTVKTEDCSLAAHVEDTIVITEGEPRVLTRPISEKGR